MSDSDPKPRTLRRVGFSLAGVVGLVAVVIAGATAWLMLTDPVTVAEAVDAGEYGPLVEEIADVLYRALVGLIRYL
jgi:hypothetical protein